MKGITPKEIALEKFPDRVVKFGPKQGQTISNENFRHGFVLGYYGQDAITSGEFESHNIWFAKDMTDNLYMTAYEPFFDTTQNQWRDGSGNGTYAFNPILAHMFRDLTFNDSPIEVEILVRKMKKRRS